MMSSGEIFGGLVMGLDGVGVPVLIGALMVNRVRLPFTSYHTSDRAPEQMAPAGNDWLARLS
jgi:hypothetical protein